MNLYTTHYWPRITAEHIQEAQDFNPVCRTFCPSEMLNYQRNCAIRGIMQAAAIQASGASGVVTIDFDNIAAMLGVTAGYAEGMARAFGYDGGCPPITPDYASGLVDCERAIASTS
jgi:hypothetical protein